MVEPAPPTSNAPAPPATADEEKVYRQMVDKRQCRKVNQESFVAAIDEWKAAHPNGPSPGKVAAAGFAADGRAPLSCINSEAAEANPPSSAAAGGSQHVQASGGVGPRRLRAILRKRPLFAYESERGEFDVVSVHGANEVVVHNCCMQPDLKRMFMKHTAFSVGEAFNENVRTPEVCVRGVHPLLANVLAGGCSTLFMYGQTGSGKTHTMQGIEEYASQLLLPATAAEPSAVDGAGDGDAAAEVIPVGHLSFFEICGSRCIELLGDSYGQDLPLKQTEVDGRVQPVGATCAPVHSAAELLELIAIAKSRRATESTGANAVSSRSHAVCQLTLRSTVVAAARPRPSGRNGNVPRRGSVAARAPILTLVDCAGTERKEDSMWHDADRRKEGAEINQSLHALKECMRHWVLTQEGKKTLIPFRESALTRVLADSFMRQDTLITVVGTVSPSASDTEHTLTTLKTVAAVAGTDNAIREVKRDVKPVVQAPRTETIPPKLWPEERLREWLQTTISSRGEPLAPALPLMPRGVTGKEIMKKTAVQIRQLWGAPQELADAVFHELRVATRAAEAAKGRTVKGVRQAEQRKRAGQLPA